MAPVARFVATLLALACAVAILLTGIAEVEAALARRSLEAEARELAQQPFVRQPGKPVIVVTGSSTVRLWGSSAVAFPEAQVINTAFGGSTMASLADHYEDLILRYSPDQVLIGSGDNDLAFGRPPPEIMAETVALLDRIQHDLPGTQVAIIAAKPSIRRWHLRDRYQRLNAEFRVLAASRLEVSYVDVWHPLLDADGHIRPELYAQDGLHLNGRGYRIYAAALVAAAGGQPRAASRVGGQQPAA